MTDKKHRGSTLDSFLEEEGPLAQNESVARVATFNCEWRKSHSTDGAIIRERVLGRRSDIVCLTEAYRDFFGSEGYTIEASLDPDALADHARRKVLLWSRTPWTAVENEGCAGLPAGRFVRGRTSTPAGEIAVIGICIPYRWSGARYGGGQKIWEAHLRYLSVLDRMLPADPERLVVLGDFNQRVPRKYQPQQVFDALDKTLLTRLNIATSGMIDGIGRQAIDHICHSRDLAALSATGLSNIGPDGREISDHFGVQATLTSDTAVPR
jgi:endonuclease/exonuclease/phosphatase family metal-dependent hydrolase